MMNSISKKENNPKLNKFIIIGILEKELNEFYIDHINKKYADLEDHIKNDMISDLYTKRLVFWSQQPLVEAKTIGLNPTIDIARTRMDNLKKLKDCTPKIFDAVVNYIKAEFENTMSLGHTDAFSYLSNINDKTLDFIPNPLITFEFKGDIKLFYKKCIEYKVIASNTTLDSFKIAFQGGDIRSFDEFQFNFKQKNHCVYFFDLLDKNGYINYKFLENNRIIETLYKIEGVSQLRYNYENSKTGVPSNSNYINQLIDSIHQ